MQMMADHASGGEAWPQQRLGMLLPSGNIIAERQVRDMLPQEIALHCTRLPLTGSSEAEIHRMTERLDEAAQLLADARVDLIAFNCTAVSTYAPGEDAGIADRITEATGIAAVTTAGALVAALRMFEARRIMLVTPYIEPVTVREAAFFRHNGFEVVDHASYGINLSWDMAHESPATWLDFVLANRRNEADAYVLSCTAIRSAEVIEELEAALARPLLTSNQALSWFAARSCGVVSTVDGFGVLLRSPEMPAGIGSAAAEVEATGGAAKGGNW